MRLNNVLEFVDGCVCQNNFDPVFSLADRGNYEIIIIFMILMFQLDDVCDYHGGGFKWQSKKEILKSSWKDKGC